MFGISRRAYRVPRSLSDNNFVFYLDNKEAVNRYSDEGRNIRKCRFFLVMRCKLCTHMIFCGFHISISQRFPLPRYDWEIPVFEGRRSVSLVSDSGLLRWRDVSCGTQVAGKRLEFPGSIPHFPVFHLLSSQFTTSHPYTLSHWW